MSTGPLEVRCCANTSTIGCFLLTIPVAEGNDKPFAARSIELAYGDS